MVLCFLSCPHCLGSFIESVFLFITEDPTIFKSEIPDCAPVESNCVDLVESERSCQIWQNFAKAFWNALKQYKEKLKVMSLYGLLCFHHHMVP